MICHTYNKFINTMMEMKTRNTNNVFMVRDNKTINNNNVSIRLFLVPTNYRTTMIESGTEDLGYYLFRFDKSKKLLM